MLDTFDDLYLQNLRQDGRIRFIRSTDAKRYANGDFSRLNWNLISPAALAEWHEHDVGISLCNPRDSSDNFGQEYSAKTNRFYARRSFDSRFILSDRLGFH